jgi:hypothetical protein
MKLLIGNDGFWSKQIDLKSDGEHTSLYEGKNYSTFSSPEKLQPATYSWENLEIEVETNSRSCFNRLTSVQKKILDNGTFRYTKNMLGNMSIE